MRCFGQASRLTGFASVWPRTCVLGDLIGTLDSHGDNSSYLCHVVLLLLRFGEELLPGRNETVALHDVGPGFAPNLIPEQAPHV